MPTRLRPLSLKDFLTLSHPAGSPSSCETTGFSLQEALHLNLKTSVEHVLLPSSKRETLQGQACSTDPHELRSIISTLCRDSGMSPATFLNPCRQSFQESSIKEYALNHIGMLTMTYRLIGYIPLTEDFWKIWVLGAYIDRLGTLKRLSAGP